MSANENLGAQFYGKQDIDALFKGHPATVAPFRRAGGRKDRQNYDQSRVQATLRHPNPPMESFNPRDLHITQGNVTRAGVQHYLSGAEGTYADSQQAGNKHPVVYKREDGRNLLLSGTHRATAALLRGKQVRAVVVEGPWGPAR